MQKVVWGAPSFWIERFPLYWGIEQGFFVKQGIDPDHDVELIPLGENYGKLDLFVDGRVE